MTPIHYKLTDTQFISDLDIQIDPNHYVTHLCADTGMGKSSWVMDVLCKQGNIIFAVPQRAQITQLKAKYGNRKDVEFIYGGHSELSENPSNIICTYDQLPAILAKVFANHYMLIIDEVHKLYQAASYRPDAVANIVDAVIDQRFSSVLTLSATFMLELVSYQIDSWLEVTRTTEIERVIELQLFRSLPSMEDAVIANIEASDNGPTVVRINNKKDIIAYQKALEGKGLRCLAVNRDLQKNESISTMLEKESIAEYDVVLTTSLMDEAININDEQINELIVFNSKIHPEELKQFVGRFRLCNPFIKLCIPEYMVGGKARDLELIKRSNVSVVKAAKQLAEVIQLDCDTLQTIRKANQTLKELFGFEPLRMRHSNIAANDAALMACLFKADTQLCYQSVARLKQTLGQVFPKLVFTVNEVESGCSNEGAKRLDDAFASIADQWYAALDNCKTAVTKEAARLKQTGKSSEDSVLILASLGTQFSVESLECSILQQWHDLHRDVMVDLWEAFDAIERDRGCKIWQFHNSARSNLYIQPILKYLKQIPQGTVMTLPEAKSCILDAFRQVSNSHSNFKEMVAESDLTGVTVKKNNHFSVTDRFTRSIFRDYTATPPVRSNNKDKITFSGIGPYGYKYRLIHDEKKKKTVRNIRRIQRAA
ncbi:DEAD/DEAH box helicase [Neptuniibacter pectenicola]|uniref:DEAD/DEAH box helicase n=1 Tax=Neptuniibacter pectenicola TaxID=1806669 RepID=A0ABU9TS76_9GAMM